MKSLCFMWLGGTRKREMWRCEHKKKTRNDAQSGIKVLLHEIGILNHIEEFELELNLFCFLLNS